MRKIQIEADILDDFEYGDYSSPFSYEETVYNDDSFSYNEYCCSAKCYIPLKYCSDNYIDN